LSESDCADIEFGAVQKARQAEGGGVNARRILGHQVGRYTEALESGDREAAAEAHAAFISHRWHHYGPLGATLASLLEQANVRLFAVLFWFMLIGPAGALLYRCAAFLAGEAATLEKPRLARAAERTFAVLDWAPARLLSLSFFLAGSFDDAMHAWRRVTAAEQDLSESNRSVVIVTGCGAMRHDVEDAFDESEHGDAYDLYWVRAARGLVLRSVVVWVTVVALLTMAGWFV
jgi:membrane protein required for beta-lactamase induction